MQNDQPSEQHQLAEVYAERDALKRELNELRAWLCVKLGILDRKPGPQGITILSTVSDREIITEIDRLTRAAGNATLQRHTLSHQISEPRSPQPPAASAIPPTPHGTPGSWTVEAVDNLGVSIASMLLTRELQIRLPDITDTRYPILRFLDPYGDLTLNQFQIDQLLIELDQLQAEVCEPAALQCIHALAALARTAQAAQPHITMIFIGD